MKWPDSIILIHILKYHQNTLLPPIFPQYLLSLRVGCNISEKKHISTQNLSFSPSSLSLKKGQKSVGGSFDQLMSLMFFHKTCIKGILATPPQSYPSKK